MKTLRFRGVKGGTDDINFLLGLYINSLMGAW